MFTGWSAFHTEVDYGQEGHKKKPEYDTREEAFEAITRFELKPTIVNHSGGGFHCYWILNRASESLRNWP